MSNIVICPECGKELEEGSTFCDDCGAVVKPEQKENQKPAAHQTGEVIGAGARANITGGVHTSHSTNQQLTKNNIDNSSRVDNSSVTNTLTKNSTTTNTSVDNSSTVNNSTTIVMNGSKDEYCAVCGNVLEEKHPRCPKCGKSICPDCRVASKNRCVACEKKALNEYRSAFQQLLLTTGGDIGVAGRQMMNQKAHDLDVEDKMASIEADLMKGYKPAPKPVQPQVVVTETKKTVAPKNDIISEVDEHTATPAAPTIKSTKSTGNSVWGIVVLLLIIIGFALFFVAGGDEEKKAQPEVVVVETPAKEVEQPKKEAPAAQKAAPASAPASAPAAAPAATSAPASVSTAASAPAAAPAPAAPVKEVKTDANYEAGMAAYSAGKCLDAINAFNKSGTADAYYMIGLIYEEGCGTIGKNAMLARKNFKKAAQMGSAAAKAKL